MLSQLRRAIGLGRGEFPSVPTHLPGQEPFQDHQDHIDSKHAPASPSRPHDLRSAGDSNAQDVEATNTDVKQDSGNTCGTNAARVVSSVSDDGLTADMPASLQSTIPSSIGSRVTDLAVYNTQSTATSTSGPSPIHEVARRTDSADVELFKRIKAQCLYTSKESAIRVPKEHEEKWENEDFGRLKADLKEAMMLIYRKGVSNQAKRLKDTQKVQPRVKEHDIFFELRMSGRSPRGAEQVTLSPCIWILCGSSWACRAMTNAMNGITWPELPVEIHKGRSTQSIPVLSSTQDVIDITKLDLTNGIELAEELMLFINVEDPVESSSACGLLCCATIKHGNTFSHEFSRIGGLVTTDAQSSIFGISTAHGILNNEWWQQTRATRTLSSPTSSTTTHVGDLDVDGPDDEIFNGIYEDPDDEDDDTAYEESQNPGDKIALDDYPPDERLGFRDPGHVSRWRNVTRKGRFNFLGDSLSTMSELEHIIRQSNSSAPTDHAIIDLSNSGGKDTPKLSNSYQLPGAQAHQSQTVHLQDLAKNRNLETASVSILCTVGSAQEGELLPGPTCLSVDGQLFTLRKIKTRAPLALGTSGSWVVRGTAVYGMILAVSPVEPYAFMITAEQLVSDIKTQWPTIAPVDLIRPTKVGVDQLLIVPKPDFATTANVASKATSPAATSSLLGEITNQPFLQTGLPTLLEDNSTLAGTSSAGFQGSPLNNRHPKPLVTGVHAQAASPPNSSRRYRAIFERFPPRNPRFTSTRTSPLASPSLDSQWPHETRPARSVELRRQLRSYQIFFIVFSCVVGTGVYTTNSQALELAGPLGLLVAVLLFGVIAIAVFETMGEFAQIFPVPNAFVSYIRAFVDEDLAWIVGISYWFAYSTAVSIELMFVFELLQYWNLTSSQAAFILLAGFAIVIVINLFNISVFGMVQSIIGALKMVLCLGVAAALFTVVAKENSAGNLGDGFTNNAQFASSPIRAFCYAFPMVGFSYMGVESIAVTLPEARDVKSVMKAQPFHWVTLALYVLVSLGVTLVVSWTDPGLLSIYDQPIITRDVDNIALLTRSVPASISAAVLGISGLNTDLAGFVNGGIIFSAIGAASTNLYIASRTLHGLANSLHGNDSFSRPFRKFIGRVQPGTSVPLRAVIVSAIAFCWLPFLDFGSETSTSNRIQTMFMTFAEVSVIMVWAFTCVAFIRYYMWTKSCAEDLNHRGLEHYSRASKNASRKQLDLRRGLSATIARFQPLVAWIGLAGCVFTLVSMSASWWDTPASETKVVSAYGVVIIFFCVWITLKLWKRKWHRSGWWISTTAEPRAEYLIKSLQYLEALSNGDAVDVQRQTLYTTEFVHEMSQISLRE